MTLQLSTDGFWRTRDGRKLRIYAMDGIGGTAIHGAMYTENRWYPMSWHSNGYQSRVGEMKCDIVGRWPEEKAVEAWVWLWSSGSVTVSGRASSTMERQKCLSDRVVGAVRLTGTVIEGVFE